MSGILGDRRVRSFPGDDKPTCPTFSDEEIDEQYGITSPLPDVCSCWRGDAEYLPESCDRADHRAEAGDVA